MFPRQAIYKSLLRQGLINFARVGTAVPCLPSMFRIYTYSKFYFTIAKMITIVFMSFTICINNQIYYIQ